jgi:hypothetical protein
MKIVISPAKSLNFETELPTLKYTEPAFLKESRQIQKVLSKVSKRPIWINGYFSKISRLELAIQIGKRLLLLKMRVLPFMLLMEMFIQAWMPIRFR